MLRIRGPVSIRTLRRAVRRATGVLGLALLGSQTVLVAEPWCHAPTDEGAASMASAMANGSNAMDHKSAPAKSQGHHQDCDYSASMGACASCVVLAVSPSIVSVVAHVTPEQVVAGSRAAPSSFVVGPDVPPPRA